MSKKHHIVIVGGGAGGLELATKLGNTVGKKQQADVTLVDGTLTHFWKPLLHEVAAGTINAHIDELSYAAHARAHHFSFRLGYMDRLDRDRKYISLAPTLNSEGNELVPRREFHYDTLILAVGSQTNDFGTEGVGEHCLFLDSQNQAQNFHRAFLEKWMIASTQSEPLRPGQMNIAIAGAGATGVELTAELHTAINEMRQTHSENISDIPVEFTLLDAAPRVLPVLPEKVSQSTQRVLEKLGVRIMTGEMITKATPEGFHTKSGEFVPAEIKVWAAGIKAPEWLSTLGLSTNRINQLEVRQTLQSVDDDDIFALGDCASCPQPNSERPVPPRAQSAHQQADILYKSLVNRLKGKDAVDFVYSDKGSLVNLSRYSTVGNLMGNLFSKSTEVKIEGLMARFAYMSLYKMHQQALHGFTWVVLMTLANLITKGIKPRLKLH
ncbi:NADH dehydrogenase ii [gamma proteobacterium HTCC5015]|nr:NADH dehydrogenase ii [gamma proteobacterium HTCC5015]